MQYVAKITKKGQITIPAELEKVIIGMKEID